jgi:hypothetical protein
VSALTHIGFRVRLVVLTSKLSQKVVQSVKTLFNKVQITS